MTGANGAWSEEEKAQLRTLKRQGLDNETIAERMHRSVSSIKRKVARHNQVVRRRKAWLDANRLTQ
jgi:IS30 family transposase